MAGALALAATALYHRVLGLFWLYDDPFHLRLVLEHRPVEYLFDRAVAVKAVLGVHPAVFLLSHEVDLALFGVDPGWHYAHQLATVAACAAALFAVLRLWLPRWAAALGGGVWLLGPTVAACAPLLMVRQYFEALLLAGLSAGAHAVGLRRQRLAWAAASAALFLAATLHMVIALPLPALLALLPEGPWRRRLRFLLHHAAAVAIYFGYRMWLIGPGLASYGWAVQPGDYLGLALALPGKVAGQLAGGCSITGAVLLAVLLGGALALSWRGLALFAAALAAGVLPILPVSTEMQPRYALAAWTVLAAASACGCARLARRGQPWRWLGAGVAALAILSTALAGRATVAEELAEVQRMSDENRFFATLTERDLLRHPASSAATLGELGRLQARRGRGPHGGAWFKDDLYLCLGLPDGRRIWGYEVASRTLRDVTAETLESAVRECGAVRWDAPLAARFTWREGGLFWDLGPHASPGYAMVFDDGRERIAVPRRGGYQWPAEEVTLRVRYADPEGWVTYSPALRLQRGQPELRWVRP